MVHNILIADDSQLNRALVKNVLASRFPEQVYYEAENGQEVMDIVSSVSVDLIILDLIMPVKDGFSTLEDLKNSTLYSHIPVIVSSALSEISSIEKTLKAGAIDYFTKPLSNDDMNIILPLKVNNALLMHDQNLTIQRLNHELNIELKNANDFAKFMLPKSSQVEKVELSLSYYPSIGIGGDFFDCLEVDGKTWFMVADVTGHGIAAGMASSMVKVFFRMTVDKGVAGPKELIENINNKIFEIFGTDNFQNYVIFTAFVGCICDGVLTYSNAGQPYPLIYKINENKVVGIEEGGVPVGMLEGIEYDEHTTDMDAGDVIFVYTDGLFSTGAGTDFTNWELVQRYTEINKEKLIDYREQFLDDIYWHFHFIHGANDATFTDDVAMMLLKVK